MKKFASIHINDFDQGWTLRIDRGRDTSFRAS